MHNGSRRDVYGRVGRKFNDDLQLPEDDLSTSRWVVLASRSNQAFASRGVLGVFMLVCPDIQSEVKSNGGEDAVVEVSTFMRELGMKFFLVCPIVRI